jgi:hypothetical protein
MHSFARPHGVADGLGQLAAHQQCTEANQADRDQFAVAVDFAVIHIDLLWDNKTLPCKVQKVK